MMDRERQEKDLQEVFETTQGAYRAAVENTFALQEQTLEFARNLLEAPPETLRDQAENNRVTLEALVEGDLRLTFVGAARQERRYATLDALGAALAFAYQVNVRPTEAGRYYYTGSLQVSTLSDADLDELERFLAGDLEGTAEGGEDLGDALGRGATRFLLRLAGLPSLRLEARSRHFTVR